MPISLGFQREVEIDETKIRETSERERADGNRSIYIYASACASASVIPVCTGDNSRSSFLAHLGSLLLGYANKHLYTPPPPIKSDKPYGLTLCIRLTHVIPKKKPLLLGSKQVMSQCRVGDCRVVILTSLISCTRRVVSWFRVEWLHHTGRV